MDIFITKSAINYGNKHFLIDDIKQPVYVIADDIGSILPSALGLNSPPVSLGEKLINEIKPFVKVGNNLKTGFLLSAGNTSFAGTIDNIKNPNSKFYIPYKINAFCLNNIIAAKFAHSVNCYDFIATDGSACASSIKSLSDAYNLIQSGQLDSCIVLALDYQVSISIIEFFASYGGVLTAKDIDNGALPRAFDNNDKGFLLGHGGAVCLLENKKSLLASKNEKLALIKSIAIGSEVCDNPLSQLETGDGYKNIIYNLLKKSKVKAKDIDLLKTHGTGTDINNKAEAAAIKEVFNNSVTSVAYKPEIGHTLGVSGLLEILISLYDAKSGYVRETKNLSQLEHSFLSSHKQFKEIKYIMGLASGMGNIFAGAIVEKIN